MGGRVSEHLIRVKIECPTCREWVEVTARAEVFCDPKKEWHAFGFGEVSLVRCESDRESVTWGAGEGEDW